MVLDEDATTILEHFLCSPRNKIAGDFGFEVRKYLHMTWGIDEKIDQCLLTDIYLQNVIKTFLELKLIRV